jgi:glycopeptide antibiotics resistance protein
MNYVILHLKKLLKQEIIKIIFYFDIGDIEVVSIGACLGYITLEIIDVSLFMKENKKFPVTKEKMLYLTSLNFMRRRKR